MEIYTNTEIQTLEIERTCFIGEYSSNIERTPMAADEFLKLFDAYWYEHDLFTGKNNLSNSSARPVPQEQQEAEESNITSIATLGGPCLRLDNGFNGKVSPPMSTVKSTKILTVKLTEQHEAEEPKVSCIAALRVRSLSDQCLRLDNSFNLHVSSPRSVITASKLPKIISGTELCDLDQKDEEKEKNKTRRERGKPKGHRRSLSDLEYKELKGFMDLGFVFTEEDKTSNLVSILPGLQSWGEKEAEKIEHAGLVPRPYLSEAWGTMGRRRINKRVVPWRFPDLKNDITMKDHLKAWAHTVASTVR